MKKFLIDHAESFGVYKITKFLSRKKLKILMYHRILEHPFIGGLSPEIFEEQIRYLTENFTLLSINELLANRRNKKIIPNSVAITFDDGHKDFYETAWPILRKYKVPATLYITTGFIDYSVWLWPDLLKYILLNSIGKNIFHGLEAFQISEENLLFVWNKIADELLVTPTQERKDILKSMAITFGVDIDHGPAGPFGAVKWEELQEMVAQGLDVGSHTVMHPILSDLSGEQLEFEFRESKREIEKRLGITPAGICYPNGMARDINLEVEQYAKKYFDYGVVAFPSGYDPSRPMRIGRYSGSSPMQYFKRLINGAVIDLNKTGQSNENSACH